MKQEKCPQCGGPIFPENVINEKKDACYYKVKSRYKVWPSAYACVPEETSKALTRDGWKHVDNLSIGEEIMTYNMSKDIMEFKPIMKIHRYTDVETNVIKSGNTGFIFECTPNHKWIIKMPDQKSDRISKYEKINGMALIETKEMLEAKNGKHLVVSALYEGGSSVKKDKIFKYGDNWIKYILDITPEQRQSWLFSAIVYDGNQKKTERVTENKGDISDLDWIYSGNHGKQSFGFKQKDTEHRDAFLLAAFLNGGTVTWREHNKEDIYSCYYTSNKKYKNLSNFKIIEENIKDVWCPETENNTWIMMQETDGKGIITITGNSGALVKCRKSGSKNWGSKKENMQLKNKKLSEQEVQIDQAELQKIQEKNLKFIKKLINPDTVGAGNALSDSQKSAMMDNAMAQEDMKKNPIDLIKFALDIGYSLEDVLASIPQGIDLSKDLPKS